MQSEKFNSTINFAGRKLQPENQMGCKSRRLLTVRLEMNAIKLFCSALLLSGLACKHQFVSSVQDKDFKCNKLVEEIIVAQRAFVVALKSVQDLETANKAAVKIRETAERLDGISGNFVHLGPLSEELKLRLLKKLELEDRREHLNLLKDARVFTPEESKIINSATELFFENWQILTTKSGLYYTPSEYHNAAVTH